MTLEELLPMSRAELARTFNAGHDFDAARLDGHLYRGVSLGLWGWVETLSWKTFAKCFYQGRGWNIRLHQDGLSAPPRPLRPRGFGHFDVVRQKGAVVLDYGINPAWDPMAALRDPLRAFVKEDPTRLLGYSLVAVGPWQVPTPSYFLLERVGPLPFIEPRADRSATAA